MKNAIFIRKVKKSDIEEVFNLSNQDYVRKHSLNKKKIKWDDHVIWFNNIIEDKNSIFYVVTDEMDRFLGQIRYKIDSNVATVSISLSNLIKGKGYSRILLLKSMGELFNERKEVDKIIAYVSEKNIPSIKLFEKAGFYLCRNEEGLLKYICSRGE